MIPIYVTVGPLATSSAGAIATSQTPPGNFNFVLDGTLGTALSSAIGGAQQASSAGASFTLNGATVSNSIAYLATSATYPTGQYVTFTSTGNMTGTTFTITGIGSNGYASNIETVTGANASKVSSKTLFTQVTSITASASSSANITIGTNGIATLDKPRRVIFTSSGNDSTNTFTIRGTDWNGQAQVESILGSTGTGASVQTLFDYATITSITASSAANGNIQVGTNGVASSRPIFLDLWANAPTMVQVSVSSAGANYTVQQSVQNPNDTLPGSNTPIGYTGLSWVNHSDTNLVASSSTAQGGYAYAPSVVRATLNSGSGAIQMVVAQASTPQR